MTVSSSPQRTTLLLALLVVAAAMMAGLVYLRFAGQRDLAARAAGDLAEASRLAAHIRAAREASTTSGEDAARQGLDVPTRIKRAAGEASIDDDVLANITPGAARRIGNTDYAEVPVPLRLEGVRARQLVAFLHAVSRPESGLVVKDVKMHDDDDDVRGDGTWVADVTLTYLTYRPRESRS